MLRLPALLLLSVLTLAACSEAEDTRPGQPVKTRQAAFKDIIKAFEPMGVMLRKEHFDAEKFARLADQLAERKNGPWAHFGPDTNYPPTKSTPAVWSKPEQFEREKQNFLRAVDILSKAAQSRDEKQVAAPYAAVYEACQSCHREFKQR